MSHGFPRDTECTLARAGSEQVQEAGSDRRAAAGYSKRPTCHTPADFSHASNAGPHLRQRCGSWAAKGLQGELRASLGSSPRGLPQQGQCHGDSGPVPCARAWGLPGYPARTQARPGVCAAFPGPGAAHGDRHLWESWLWSQRKTSFQAARGLPLACAAADRLFSHLAGQRSSCALQEGGNFSSVDLSSVGVVRKGRHSSVLCTTNRVSMQCLFRLSLLNAEW